MKSFLFIKCFKPHTTSKYTVRVMLRWRTGRVHTMMRCWVFRRTPSSSRDTTDLPPHRLNCRSSTRLRSRSEQHSLLNQVGIVTIMWMDEACRNTMLNKSLLYIVLKLFSQHAQQPYFSIGNEVILKQIRTLKAKKTAALAGPVKKAAKQLDAATIKEVCRKND